MATKTSPIVAVDRVGGITVSTVRTDRGYWETCLFDDRNGKRYGNRSRVVATYGTDDDARNGHREWYTRPVSVLLAAIAESYE